MAVEAEDVNYTPEEIGWARDLITMPLYDADLKTTLGSRNIRFVLLIEDWLELHLKLEKAIADNIEGDGK